MRQFDITIGCRSANISKKLSWTSWTWISRSLAFDLETLHFEQTYRSKPLYCGSRKSPNSVRLQENLSDLKKKIILDICYRFKHNLHLLATLLIFKLFQIFFCGFGKFRKLHTKHIIKHHVLFLTYSCFRCAIVLSCSLCFNIQISINWNQQNKNITLIAKLRQKKVKID